MNTLIGRKSMQVSAVILNSIIECRLSDENMVN